MMQKVSSLSKSYLASLTQLPSCSFQMPHLWFPSSCWVVSSESLWLFLLPFLDLSVHAGLAQSSVRRPLLCLLSHLMIFVITFDNPAYVSVPDSALSSRAQTPAPWMSCVGSLMSIQILTSPKLKPPSSPPALLHFGQFHPFVLKMR